MNVWGFKAGQSARRAISKINRQFPETNANVLPIGVSVFKDAESPRAVIAVDDDETAVVLALISEFEALYKHYDNQKHRFGTILILVAGGLSSAPFLFDFAAHVVGVLIVLSAIVIIILSRLSLIVLDHLRERMKLMEYRVEELRGFLSKKYPNIDIPGVITRAKRKAADKLRGEGKKKNEKISRGAVWDALPKVAIAYACFYALEGVSIIIHPEILNNDSSSVAIDRSCLECDDD